MSAEFFAGFVTSASDFGRDWGVHHYGLRGHQRDKAADDRSVAELLANEEISPWPSGELVAELLDGMMTGTEHHLPMNLPNPGPGREPAGRGHRRVHRRDRARRPPPSGRHPGRLGARRAPAPRRRLPGAHGRGRPHRRPDAGDRGHARPTRWPVNCPTSSLVAMTDELLAATAPWLPQFASACADCGSSSLTSNRPSAR